MHNVSSKSVIARSSALSLLYTSRTQAGICESLRVGWEPRSNPLVASPSEATVVQLDAGLVAVEGRDVKHVAVCANPDGLHLAVPGQRSRMGGTARAEDLK